MNYDGLIVGAGAFLIIGLLHPVVIKGEYYFTKNIWPIFLVLGLASLVGCIWVSNSIIRSLLAVLGFSLLWSIKEIFEQEERVKKGWFKANPKRIKKD